MTYPLHRYADVRANVATGTPLPAPFTTVLPRERLSPAVLIAQPTRRVTSLTFLGRFTPGYGEAFNENLLHLTENFAGSAEPLAPITGQIWYNPTDRLLRYCVNPAAVFSENRWFKVVRQADDGSAEAGNIFLSGADGAFDGDPCIFFGTRGQADSLADRIQFDESENELQVYADSGLIFSINNNTASTRRGAFIPGGGISDYWRGTYGLYDNLIDVQAKVEDLLGDAATGTAVFNNISAGSTIWSDRYRFRSDTDTGMDYGTDSGMILFRSNGRQHTRFDASGALFTAQTYDETSGSLIGFISSFGGRLNLVRDHALTDPVPANNIGAALNFTRLGEGNTAVIRRVADELQVLVPGGDLRVFAPTDLVEGLNVTGPSTLNGALTVSSTGSFAGELTTSSRVRITGAGPALALQDTNQRSGFVHVNNNIFYILRGDVNAVGWMAADQINGRWPFTINFETGFTEVAGGFRSNANSTVAGSLAVTSGLGVTGALSVTGPATITGNLQVNGAITANGDITAFSDIKFKEEVETISDALKIVAALRGVYYTDTRDGQRRSGFVAQEVERTMPDLVVTNEDGTLSLAYPRMTAVLVEAVKELKARSEVAERSIVALEEKIASLTSKLEAIVTKLGG